MVYLHTNNFLTIGSVVVECVPTATHLFGEITKGSLVFGSLDAANCYGYVLSFNDRLCKKLPRAESESNIA